MLSPVNTSYIHNTMWFSLDNVPFTHGESFDFSFIIPNFPKKICYNKKKLTEFKLKSACKIKKKIKYIFIYIISVYI